MNNYRKVLYTQTFRQEWKTDVILKDWIEEDDNDKTNARCKYCKSTITARYADLRSHFLSKKHIKASEPYFSSNQPKLPFKAVSNTQIIQSANIEAATSLFVVCHTAISTIDHLIDLSKKCFKGFDAVEHVKLHRTKCNAIIRNIFFPFFKNNLRDDLGSSNYSVLLDESTDTSVFKQLGICIMYYSEKSQKVVSTFLSLIKLDSGNAENVVKGLKKVLFEYNIDIKNMCGIRSDNASVMTGKNNGVHALIQKEVDHVVLVRCMCHSIKLSMSAATDKALPDYLEFMISETYNWFAHSTTRQLSYKLLFNTLNSEADPLKIVRVANARWLSIEIAMNRVVDQWFTLKEHFKFSGTKERCYKARLLYNMYSDINNKLYFIFLKPILSEAQHINKLFQSNEIDPTKLLGDLILFIEGLVRQIVVPGYNYNLMNINIKEHLHPTPYLGYAFEEELKASNIQPAAVKTIRGVDVKFIIELVSQLQKRLPSNVDTLKQICILGPQKSLNSIKESIIPLAQLMKFSALEITKIDSQWQKLHLVKWQKTQSTLDLWKEINEFRDSLGINHFQELCKLAKCLLVLPWSIGEVERTFSQMNLIKNGHRNKMTNETTNAILTIRAGMRQNGQCCNTFRFPDKILLEISTMSRKDYEKNISDTDSELKIDVSGISELDDLDDNKKEF